MEHVDIQYVHDRFRNERIIPSSCDNSDYRNFIGIRVCDFWLIQIIVVYSQSKIITMRIQEKIVDDLKQAMKARDVMKTGFLKTFVSEMSRQPTKVLSDEQALPVVQWLFNNAETMENQIEMDYLSQFLPTKLSEFDVKMIVGKIIAEQGLSTMKDMGKVMGALKQRSDAASIDNSVASEYAKYLLNIK